MSERKRPGFILYQNTARVIASLPEREAGELIRAVCIYELENRQPEFKSQTLGAIFEGIKADLEEDARRYKMRCEQNAKAARARWENQEGN